MRGPPAALALWLAHRASSLSRRPLLVLTVACLSAALAPNRRWFLAPLLVPPPVTAAYLAYREVFYDRHPEPTYAGAHVLDIMD